MLQADFGTDVAQMFAHTHPMLVFPQQFTANHVTIFRYDPHQPVVVFGMVPHQLGQTLHLPLQPIQAARPSPSWDWPPRLQT